MLLEILNLIVFLFMFTKYMGIDVDLSSLEGLKDFLNLGGDAEEETEE